jgi:hypothetical protein
LEATWSDPRLVHDGGGPVRKELSEIWHPGIIILNRQRMFKTLPDVALVEPDGEVMIRQRIWGDFSQPLELQEFPFDQQVFQVSFLSAIYGPHEVLMIQDPERKSLMAPRFSLPDWTIIGLETPTRIYRLAEDMPGRSMLSVSLTATRKTGYYVIKVILPFILIVMMSWIVFWIDPEQTGTQIGMAATAMLTLIAYRFAVDQLIPAVSYLTRLDGFILAATVLVFLSLIEGVLTAWWNGNGKRPRALKADKWCRTLSPIVLLGLVMYAFVF